jgi:hypothetical protein
MWVNQSGRCIPSAKVVAAANIRYISHVPVTRWKNPFALVHVPDLRRLAGISVIYTRASNTNSIPTGLSPPLKNTNAPVILIHRNAIAIYPSTVGSPPTYLLIPSANQCTPYAVKANPAI